LKKRLKFKIFWVGPYMPPKYFKDWIAANPAAMKWQNHLIKALADERAEIERLYYYPEPYWPKGKLLPSRVKISSSVVSKQNKLDYINTIGFRDYTLFSSLKKILKKKTKNNIFKNHIIISYNSPKWINKIFLDQDIRSKFCCVYVVADTEVLPGANGYVFLSYHSYKNQSKEINKLHLDGAIYPKINLKNNLTSCKTKNKKTIFVYSGSFHRWSGFDLLMEAMKHIKDDNFELWVSGPNMYKNLMISFKKDKRVKFLGLLSETDLEHTYKNADIFINPRPVNTEGNEINFPSKLFDYFSWNKPIISTRTKSLSPEYNNILHFVKDNPEAIASAMKSYIKNKKLYIKKFDKFKKEKNWNNEAKKLIKFLQQLKLN